MKPAGLVRATVCSKLKKGVEDKNKMCKSSRLFWLRAFYCVEDRSVSLCACLSCLLAACLYPHFELILKERENSYFLMKIVAVDDIHAHAYITRA